MRRTEVLSSLLSALLLPAANGNHEKDKEITHWVSLPMKQRKSLAKEIRHTTLADPGPPSGLHLDMNDINELLAGTQRYVTYA